jgi:hypothetical protein
MNAEDMDDCPVCERVTIYDGDRCTECGRLWGIDYSAADIADRLAHERAERIAANVAKEYVRRVGRGNYRPGDYHGQYRLPEHIQALIEDAATAAALAALIEKENAR